MFRAISRFFARQRARRAQEISDFIKQVELACYEPDLDVRAARLNALLAI